MLGTRIVVLRSESVRDVILSELNAQKQKLSEARMELQALVDDDEVSWVTTIIQVKCDC